MIIPDYMLKMWAAGGGLCPYSEDCINPASVDLRWSGKFRRAMDSGALNSSRDVWSEVCELDLITLYPGHLVLMDTLEFVKMPPDCCGTIALKSSIGRIGLEHMHAGFIDPGFRGTITLEMCVMSPWPIKLVKGQRIVQLMLMEMKSAPSQLYNGRYQGDSEPTPNKREV